MEQDKRSANVRHWILNDCESLWAAKCNTNWSLGYYYLHAARFIYDVFDNQNVLTSSVWRWYFYRTRQHLDNKEENKKISIGWHFLIRMKTKKKNSRHSHILMFNSLDVVSKACINWQMTTFNNLLLFFFLFKNLFPFSSFTVREKRHLSCVISFCV